MVAAGQPPGGKTADLDGTRLGDRLVAAEVDERSPVAVGKRPRGSDTELGSDVVGDGLALPDRVLRGHRADSTGRVGHRGAIAERPDAVHSLHAHRLVDRDASVVADRNAELAQAWVGGDAGCPDDGAGRDRLARGEQDAAIVNGLQPGAQPHVDAAAADLAQRPLGEVGVSLGQDPVLGLDDHPVHALQPRPWIALDRVDREVLELGECFEARVAGADEDEGQQFAAAYRVVGGIGGLELLDHLVTEPDRVGEALEADRALEAGHRQQPRDRAQCEHELVVANHLGVAVVLGQLDCTSRRIVRGDRAQPEICALEHVAQRRDHVARLQGSSGGLGQERRVEQEVDVVDERQPRRLLRHQLLQTPGGMGSTEATTGYDDIPGHAPTIPPCNNLLQGAESDKPA